MGVTIHFEGKLQGQDQLTALIQQVNGLAAKNDWPVKMIDEPEATRLRVIEEEDVEYSGPISGIEVQPHSDAEPLRFEFDDQFFAQDYCKTQFAGVDVHIAIINMLRQISPLFVKLRVEDEGEYWETSNDAVLQGHFVCVDELIDEIRQREPNAQGPIRLESGRIVDIIHD